MTASLTRRTVLALIPGVAATALFPGDALSQSTPAQVSAAWQGLTEALWASRKTESNAWLLEEPCAGEASAASQAARLLWEHPQEVGSSVVVSAERERIGALIASGRFWPLTV